jgi:hypothetical protein
MSQQMNYEEGRGEQQAPPFNNYQSGYQQDPFMGSYGQKLSTPVDTSRGASVGQRLALAIVSICMLVPLSGIVLGTTASQDNPLTLIGGLAALGVICITIMVVNIAFSWRR